MRFLICICLGLVLACGSSDEELVPGPDTGSVEEVLGSDLPLVVDAGVDEGQQVPKDLGNGQDTENIPEVVVGPSCGDGICNGIETPGSCLQDCPSICGDSLCTGDEASIDCPEDCGSLCGDGVCNGAELPGSCISDCGHGNGSCSTVPLPEPVEQSPSDQTVQGSYEATTVNGFTDDYITNGDDSFKIGIRREWGATIIFYGLSGTGPGLNTSNVIDAHDTGREVQVAFYDPERNMQGCAHNGSCQTNPGAACPSQITFLGWNPVQGGNECNQGSGVESVNMAGGKLITVTHPVHWNPDWMQPNCDNNGCSSPATSALKSDVLYTQRLRFISSNVVEMEMEVRNLGDVHHKEHPQEFPTLYASFGYEGTQNLNGILDSAGQQIVTTGFDGNGFNYGDFISDSGWATLQNQDLDYGVGLYYENRIQSFRAYWKDGVFNNFRSMLYFGLKPFATVKARAYLILGGFDTVETLADGLDNGLAPFGVLDSPAPEANIAGNTMSIEGWVLDNKEVIDLEVLVDAQMVATLPLSDERPDVCDTYPGYGMCANQKVGFSGSFSTENLSPCPHLLEVRASDNDGNTRVIARQRFYLGDSAPTAFCGDGECQTNEDSENCPQDCEEVPNQDLVPIYRFFKGDGDSDDHMFSSDPGAPAGYSPEGQQFLLFAQPGPGLTPLYQSYCASCMDHLQTVNSTEGSPVYTNPIVLGYCAISSSTAANTELRRVHQPTKKDHFVTINQNELESVTSLGYIQEGVVCYVP